MQYALKLKSNPSNPTYETVFEPQYKTLFENKPNMIPSFGIRISSEFENMNTILQNSKSQMFHPGPFLSPVFYFHCTLTRSLKLILLFFEINVTSCCLTSLAMRLYLQMVQRMVTQLDQPVLLRLTHINIDNLTMPLFFFSGHGGRGISIMCSKGNYCAPTYFLRIDLTFCSMFSIHNKK